MKQSKSIRVAMLGHKRIPSREGGIEVVVEEIATRLVQEGHQVTCYNRAGHHVAGIEYIVEHADSYKGIRCKKVLTINRKGIAAVTSSVFGTIASAFGPYDVIHFHAEGPAMMCWLPKLLGKRIIVTVHGLDHQRTKWGKIASTYIMCGEKNAVRFADEIIVLSRGNQKYFKDTYQRDTVFIPNGIQKKPNRPANQITDRWNLKKDDYLLYVGRLVPEKGIHYLIEAFKQVHTNKKLVIAGGSSDSGKYIKTLHQMAEGDDRILFTNFVQGRVKHELYSNAYVYVLPSDLEGMPLTVLEGMSYGNCCLVSSIDECVEVVEDKAVIFEQSNVTDLRDKIQMLCDDEKMVNKYKEEAADFILDKYNWDDAVDETLALYRG